MKKKQILLGNWIITYRWPIIVTTLLLVCFAGYGGQYLQLNNDTRVFFSEQNPQLLKLEAVEDIFSKNENVLIAVAPRNGDVFTRENLAAIEELTTLCWKTPFSSRVDSITNFQNIKAKNDELIVEDLVQNAHSLTDKDIALVKEIALSEPLLVNRLISSSGHVAGINVNIIKPDENRNVALGEIAHYIRTTTKAFTQKYPDMDIYLTGLIMLDVTLGEASQHEMSILIPIMLLVLLALILISLRSVRGALMIMVVILFSTITGMGFAGWAGIQISPPSSNAPVVILTLAVADCIHFLITLFQLMRQGKTKHEAIVESIRINQQAIFLTSLTTAIGFLSMNFSEAPPFRDLGNIVAVGVSAAYLYAILFLPALSAVIPLKVRARKDVAGPSYINQLARFVVRRQGVIFWGLIVFTLGMSFGVSKIELNDDYIRYFDTEYDFRADSDFIMKNLTGLYAIEYALDSGTPGGINDPEFLKTVDAFSAWYAGQPKVVNVNTFTDSLKRINKKLHNDDSAYYRIPDNREVAAQYRLLYEMSLPFGLDLNDQINLDKSSLRVFVTLADLTTKELREADSRARQWLEDNASETMVTSGTGLSLLYAHISGRCINSMLKATFGALLLISFILLLALRSFKIGLISLIPNMLPALIAFGLWGITEGRVGIAFSVLAAVTIGIVVDDTIHFLSKYLRARREHGVSPEEAVIYAFDTVGAAIVVTTLTLSAGFLVLSVSGFKPSSDMGLMTVMTIFFAIILDLFLLPTLLFRFDKQKQTRRIALKPHEMKPVQTYAGEPVQTQPN